VILHTGDFKLDLTPVDGRRTDLGRIGAPRHQRGHPPAAGRLDQRRGVGLRTERDLGRAVLRRPVPRAAGRRIITACFASHIHRIQQIADAAIATGRVVATLGLSMKKNVRMARDMGLLHIPDAKLVDIEDVDKPARAGVHHLHRVARASRCRRCR
jgi:ribonuclease J